MASTVESFGLMNAFAQTGAATDYRALVCIFLHGGNDGNNMVIPYEDTGSDFNFTMYDRVRGGDAGLALPKSSLDSLTVTPPSVGRRFAFHPSMPEMRDFFNAGKLAVVCNTGPLVEPLTRAAYVGGTARVPTQLFSHSSQVILWQTAIAESVAPTGWGGRLADRAAALNGSATFPQAVSIAGVNTLLTGGATSQLVLPDAGTSLAAALRLDMSGDIGEFKTRRAALDQIRAADLGATLVKAASDARGRALQASDKLSTIAFRHYNTTFPGDSFAAQLQQIGRLIHVRNIFGMKRQIFFASLDGFDTHGNQRTTDGQDGLLRQLSLAVKTFYDLLAEISPSLGTDVTKEVTTCTLSDFGRTFQPSGGGAGVGSDHGWGNHQLVLGGSVRGGDFYGTYPTLLLGGPDDADDRGRWIPTTSVEQYAATLASWYGLSPGDFPAVFPLLDRFPSSNLGFMS